MKKINIIISSLILILTPVFAKKAEVPFTIQNPIEKNVKGLEILNQMLAKKGKPSKIFREFLNQNGSVTHYFDEGTKKHSFTFFFELEKAADNDELFIYSNIPEYNHTKMEKFPKSNIFYINMEFSDLPESITYTYRKKTGKFMKDPENKLFANDAKKSNLIRTSQNSGAFVYAEDFFNPKKYKKLPARSNPVYLPAQYFQNPEKTFPVIYMLDGQNLWDNESLPWGGWKVDTTMEKLISEGKMEPCIIAGISNSNFRTPEYAGWSKGVQDGEAKKEGFTPEDCTLLSEEHRKMIIEDFIPYIEKNFRVTPGRENRTIAGSSYGAYNSIYLLTTCAETFSKAGLFSGGSTGYSDIIKNGSLTKSKFKIYLDCGTADALEKELITETKNLYTYLKENGYNEGSDLFYQIAEGACHNEMEWAKRVPDFLQFVSPSYK